MINAVIYARYSSHKQTEQSIEGQLRVCEDYAKNNDFKIVGSYIDRAMSGTTDNRTNFKKMIEDSKKGKFECVLVYKFDRFARNRYDSSVYKEILKKYGVKVISATEYISERPEGIILEGMLESFAEYYSAELGEKVKRGMHESALKGNSTGGTLLLGYKIKNKKYIIDEERAKIVKYIFNEYANGKTKKEILEDLNNKGIRTQKNNKFTKSSFNRMLSNTKYIGKSCYAGVESETTFPAIINKELFDKVQERLQNNKKLGGHIRAKEEYILTGKIFCGHCDSSMVGVSGIGKQKRKYCYYACNGQYKNHICNKSKENKEILENKIFETTMQFILSYEALEELATNLYKFYQSNEISAELKKLEQELKKIDDKQNNIIKLLIDFEHDEDFKTKLKEQAKFLSIQKQDLKKEYEKIEKLNIFDKTKKEILTCLKIHAKQRENETDFEYKKRLFKDFVNCVYVFDNDKFIIFYNLIGENKPTLEKAIELIKLSGYDISKLINGECSHTKPDSPPQQTP